MRSKFSYEIKTLLERLAEQPLTLADILTETSERGFSLVIGLLVLPFLFPMPPGFTTILGSACLLLSLQMMIGRRTPWLPRRVAEFKFPTVLTMQVLSNLKRVTRLTERFVRPRLSTVTESPYIWQINGAILAWLTLLLMSPIPMTNPVPTIGILLVAIATLEADGLMMCLGYGFAALTTALFGLIGYALWRSPEVIQNWLH
ncbi:MAG: exopolysaccharide biosynthesis protein [Leptolyngbyaceae cyanobacterium SM2_5_2]|nr:exopolysaccharide biosynthesis protein [Leptolyngbyaceae cyanobacterium SM2_5_2]